MLCALTSLSTSVPLLLTSRLTLSTTSRNTSFFLCLCDAVGQVDSSTTCARISSSRQTEKLPGSMEVSAGSTVLVLLPRLQCHVPAGLCAAAARTCTTHLMPSLRHETALVTAMGGFTTACRQWQE